MRDHLDQLIGRYRQKGVLVDTNLLVLLVIGLYDPDRISSFKRTATYSQSEFETLTSFLDAFDTRLTTPHVLTETSNLIGQLPNDETPKVRSVLRRLVRQLAEKTAPTKDIVSHPSFLSFGLTDSAIRRIAPGKHLVITDDLPLYHFLSSNGADTVNFNHLRPLNW